MISNVCNKISYLVYQLVSLFIINITILFSHPVVEDFNINKFMGRWYVIALVPNWIEDGTNSYDDYSLNSDGTVDIKYFTIKDGEEWRMEQKGFINKKEPGRWEVQFTDPYIPFFKAPYEVIILDSDYKYMVVGYPNNKYGWIMARSKQMDDVVYKNIINQLEIEFDYDNNAFEKVIHDK